MTEVSPSFQPPSALKFGIVVLAAGGSTRMGRPKQLLAIDGTPLVVRAVEAALASPAWPVVVVLGSGAEAVRPFLSRLPVQMVENRNWAEGIGSSIATGVDVLDQFSGTLSGGIIALADQPRLSADTFAALGRAFRGRDQIVAARYSGIVGAPVLFGRAYFPELLSLLPQTGAQSVLAAHPESITPVDRPECAIDLDTPRDYERFLDAQNESGKIEP